MEGRVRKLERLVAQQGYILLALAIAVILDTAALLFLWMGQTDKPNFDHIAVSLSAFQIMFALAAVYGFWTLRGLVKETAEEVAEREVKEIAIPIVQRMATEALETLRETDTISEAEVDEIVDAIGEAENEDGK